MIPLLVFQENTLKRIRRDFAITNKDFVVLAAGYMIQKNNYLAYFDNVELVKTLVGVTRHIVNASNGCLNVV
jgi:hypothetical protein